MNQLVKLNYFFLLIFGVSNILFGADENAILRMIRMENENAVAEIQKYRSTIENQYFEDRDRNVLETYSAKPVVLPDDTILLNDLVLSMDCHRVSRYLNRLKSIDQLIQNLQTNLGQTAFLSNMETMLENLSDIYREKSQISEYIYGESLNLSVVWNLDNAKKRVGDFIPEDAKLSANPRLSVVYYHHDFWEPEFESRPSDIFKEIESLKVEGHRVYGNFRFNRAQACQPEKFVVMVRGNFKYGPEGYQRFLGPVGVRLMLPGGVK